MTAQDKEADTTLKLWERLWPQASFNDRETWLEYCRKWWPRVPDIVATLNANKEQQKGKRNE